ncbi:MAG: hypothetical protein Q8N73_02795 [bacterium]|nr:hypothetical protein [bacterium]
MGRGLGYKTRNPKGIKYWKAIRMKEHDQAVNKIAENPKILGIDGLSSERLLHEPFIFPELKKKGQETGDLIFLWSPHLGEWEIFVIEVQIGPRRPAGDAFFKLKLTFNYLKNHWREWFESIELDLPKDYTLWVETAFVSYAGKFLWEQPFVEVRRTQIL